MIKTELTRDTYREYPAINYSLLKAYDEDPSLLELEKSGVALKTGSAVDTLLFDGLDVFNEKFKVLKYQTPTGHLEILANLYLDTEFETRNATIALELADGAGLWSSTKDPIKRRANFDKDEFWGYIEEMRSNKDKIIISPEQYTTTLGCVQKLKIDQFTSKYYIPENENISIIFQLAFSFIHSDTEFKVMLDQVILDHQNKTIIPADTKTTEKSVLKFLGSVLDYRYDLQDELYSLGIMYWRNKYYPDYSILPFKFIVVGTSGIPRSIVYQLDPFDFRNRINATRFTKLRGIHEIVHRFKKSCELQNFQYPIEYLEQGFIEL